MHGYQYAWILPHFSQTDSSGIMEALFARPYWAGVFAFKTGIADAQPKR